MQVAILAGGLATRLSPLTDKVPKSLIEIDGEPFLSYQLDFLKNSGVKDIVLCVGYLGDQIERYFGNGREFGVNLEYSHERGQLLGTAGALKNARGLLQEIFFTMYGDSYLSLDFARVLAYFESQDELALMTVYKNNNQWERSNTVIEGNMVYKFSKKERTKGMVYIEYGANIFRKKALKLIPEDQPYSLEDLFLRLIEQNELLAYEVDKRFYQIGSPQGLAEFKKYISQGKVLQ